MDTLINVCAITEFLKLNSIRLYEAEMKIFHKKIRKEIFQYHPNIMLDCTHREDAADNQ